MEPEMGCCKNEREKQEKQWEVEINGGQLHFHEESLKFKMGLRFREIGCA